jgi:hypothetical protein
MVKRSGSSGAFSLTSHQKNAAFNQTPYGTQNQQISTLLHSGFRVLDSKVLKPLKSRPYQTQIQQRSILLHSGFRVLDSKVSMVVEVFSSVCRISHKMF